MKNIIDAKYLKIALYTILVIITSILTFRLSSRSDNIMPFITGFFTNIYSILTPIIYGLLIAYLMNPAVGFFERHLIKFFNPKTPKYYSKIRVLSIILVYICIFGTIALSFRFLVPQILENIKTLINNLPNYIESSKLAIENFETSLINNLATLPFNVDTKSIFDSLDPFSLFNMQAINNFFNSIISHTLSATSILLNWIIGFVIAFYAICQKETFVNGSKRLVYAVFKQGTADKIISISSESNTMIVRFFVGKSIDSIIIGIICFVGLSILENPYALLLSLIVGVFNMIPYFGPLLGAVPAILITLFEGFLPATYVAIFILILQQFDGLVLGPKILGESIGISPFWIISAITIGGALWGPLGMFFASPILAVILITINRWIDKKLITKEIHLPQLTLDEVIPEPSKKNSITLSFSKKNKSNQ
ncbi:MAG: AI-2E family transporter [Cellulosilyticaceae bacterium]